MGFGMGFGMGFSMGHGMRTGMGVDPSVSDDLTDQAPAMDQKAMNQGAMNQGMTAINARFKQNIGISANLTAQWKNENILGQFEVSFIFDASLKLGWRSLTSSE